MSQLEYREYCSYYAQTKLKLDIEARVLPLGPGRAGVYERTEECLGIQFAQQDKFSVVFSKVDKRMLLSINITDVSKILPNVIQPECLAPYTEWSFSLHEKSDLSQPIGIGPEECSTEQVGYHWDPTIACGPQSGNLWCKRFPVPPSSSIPEEHKKPLRKYDCNPNVYANYSAFACELGDLTNKYFPLIVPPRDSEDRIEIALDIFDPHDVVPTCELHNKSLVIQCNSTRILCFTITGMKQPISSFYNVLRQEGPLIRRYHNFLSSYYASRD